MDRKIIENVLNVLDNSVCYDDSVTLTEYGKYSLSVAVAAQKISDEVYYFADLFAPQDLQNIKCDNDRYIGKLEEIEKDEMITALEGVYDGECRIIVDEGISRKIMNLSEAIKDYMAKDKPKVMER